MTPGAYGPVPARPSEAGTGTGTGTGTRQPCLRPSTSVAAKVSFAGRAS